MKRLIVLFTACLLFVPLDGDVASQGSRAIGGIGPIRIPDEQGRPVELYGESHALIIGVGGCTEDWPNLLGVRKDVLREI